MDDINLELAEILEVDCVGDDDVLADFDLWDSLAFLSICAVIDSNHNVQIDSDDFDSLETVADIKKLISSKRC